MTQPPTHPPQLSEVNLRELADARLALRKINRAVWVSKFDGWTMGLFGGLAFLMGLGGDWINILMTMALVAFAWVELRGSAMLRRLEPQATRMLGRNQLALGAVLALYFGWQICAEIFGHVTMKYIDSLDADLASTLEPYQNQVHYLVIAFYVLILLVAISGGGAMSRYYFSRAKYLEAYLKAAPQWILEMQRAGVSI